MADTAATISLQTLVKRFVLKYKINEDDYVNYLEHAADCLRDLNISHLSYAIQTNLTLDSVGKVAFPTDMIDFIALGKIEDDVYYTFVQSTDLSVPTTSEVHTDGDWNRYFYYLDWPNRIIYCQTLQAETVTLRYISSGISTSVDTVVPVQCTQVMDAYLRWMQSLMDGAGLGEQQLRKATYDDLVRHLQWQQLPTLEQFKDTWIGRGEDDTPLITGSAGTGTSTSGTGDMDSYSITVDLTAGVNTVSTAVTDAPVSISYWDVDGNLIPNSSFTTAYSLSTGQLVLTIYSVDAVDDVTIRISY